MSDTLAAALIAGCVAITVAWLAQFVSEMYKRHHEGRVVAAAITGELSSHSSALPLLKDTFELWIKAIEAGKRDLVKVQQFEPPNDVVLDEMVPKLGLLGAHNVESIVTTYATIRGFRASLAAVSTSHAAMTDAELTRTCRGMIGALESASKVGTQLVSDLRVRADAPFAPWATKARIAGVAALCALVLWFGAALVRVENQRYAMEVGLCASDPSKMLARTDCLKTVQSRTGWWWHLGYALRGD